MASIELQVISCILTSQEPTVVSKLLSFDDSYYSVFKPHISFIHEHYRENKKIPDRFTFQVKFPDFIVVEVKESLEWLTNHLIENKKQILLVETFNKIKDLGENDASDAWKYLRIRCDEAMSLNSDKPMDIVNEAQKRADTVLKYSKQARIPTGFDPIDKAMYGGLSTVEELLILLARTNSGKSWLCMKMAESAQRHGFPVLYYSPEMQASYLGTRFDTWRSHFANNQLFRGQYSEEYLNYIKNLQAENPTPLYVLENKDVPNNTVDVPFIEEFVKTNGIKLVIIDGLAYMTDARSKKGDSDYNKYKNLCEDLFTMSKQYGCAVVVVVQANRATKDSKDDKGEPFPNLYNIEGSDHPARIATQVFAARQIFEKHILDIRLEKSRNSSNQKPVFSFKWDINTGDIDAIANPEDLPTASTPVVETGYNSPDLSGFTSATAEISDLELDEEVEF